MNLHPPTLMSVNFSPFDLLLQDHLPNLNQTLCEGSLDGKKFIFLF